jgi:hypothetical protein
MILFMASLKRCRKRWTASASGNEGSVSDLRKLPNFNPPSEKAALGKKWGSRIFFNSDTSFS